MDFKTNYCNTADKVTLKYRICLDIKSMNLLLICRSFYKGSIIHLINYIPPILDITRYFALLFTFDL